MYSRLQLLLQVADNPEHCPTKGNVDIEDEREDDVLDYHDVPVSEAGEVATEIACYRTDDEPMMVLLQNLGDSEDASILLTTHNGTAPETHICPPGRSIIAYHQADQEAVVTVGAQGIGSSTGRLVMV